MKDRNADCIVGSRARAIRAKRRAAAIVLLLAGMLGAAFTQESVGSTRDAEARSEAERGARRETMALSPENLTAYRNRQGQEFTFLVTGNHGAGRVWGTDIYSDDSALAAAAVHAGVLRHGQTAHITVRVLPGRDRYTGSTRNEVNSQDWNAWHGSYSFVRLAQQRQQLANRQLAEELVHEGYALEQRQDLNGAIAKYQSAQQLAENDGVAQRIQTLQQQLANLQRAEELVHEGYALEQRGDPAGATVKYEAAQRLAPKDGVAARIQSLREDLPDRQRAQQLIHEGYALEQQGDLTGAIRNYQAAQRIDANDGVEKRIAALRNQMQAATRSEQHARRAEQLEESWSEDEWLALEHDDTLLLDASGGTILFARYPEDAMAWQAMEQPEVLDHPLRLDAEMTQALLFPADPPAAGVSHAPPATPMQPPVWPGDLVESELARGANVLADTYWAGHVIYAMQAMRMLYGELSEEDEAAFSQLWAPLFEYPSPAAIAWLQALNPLLLEFLAKQQELASLLEDLDESDFRVELAIAYGEDEDIAAAMQRVAILSGRLRVVNDRMNQLVRAIASLGDPPNALEERARARARTRHAVDVVTALAPPVDTTIRHVPRPGWTIHREGRSVDKFPEHEDFGRLAAVFEYGFEHRLLRMDGSISRDQIRDPLVYAFVIHDAVDEESIVTGRWPGWQWIDPWMVGAVLGSEAVRAGYEPLRMRALRMRGHYHEDMSVAEATTVGGYPALRWPNDEWPGHEYLVSLGQPGTPRILLLQVPSYLRFPDPDGFQGDLVERHQQFELDALLRHLRFGSEAEAPPEEPRFMDLSREYTEYRQEVLEWLAGRISQWHEALAGHLMTDMRRMVENSATVARDLMSMLRTGRYSWTPTYLHERWREHGYFTSGIYSFVRTHGDRTNRFLPTARVLLEPGARVDLLPQPIEEVGELEPCNDSRVLRANAFMSLVIDPQTTVRGTAANLAAQGLFSFLPTADRLPVGNMFGVGDWNVAGIETPERPEEIVADDDPMRARIRLHLNNIQWFQQDIARLNRALRDSQTSDQRTFLRHQLTIKRADLQGQRDAITTLQTGNFVRTPTAWDRMVREQMLTQSRELTARVARSRRNLDRIDHMIDTLPAGDRGQMRDWANRQLQDASLDIEQQVQVGQVIARNMQARAEQEMAGAMEDEAWAQLAVDILENYRQAATYTMYATPFVAGGGVLSISYGITSGGIAGYAEQGNVYGAVQGAAITSLRFWSPKVDYALTAHEGYQAGGVEGAIRHVATTYVQRKAVQTATQAGLRVQGRIQTSRQQARRQAWREARRQVDFREERAAGRALAEQHQRQFQSVRQMRQQGYIEVDGIRYSGNLMRQTRTWTEANRALMDTTAAIKHSPHAKFWMKRGADPMTQRDYNITDRLHTQRIVRDLRQELRAQGVDPSALRFCPIRNAGNTSPGMDLDLAMTFAGNARSIKRVDSATGHAHEMEMAEANAYVQGLFDRVYARNSGRRTARGSWQMVTSSQHQEAYTDVNWLSVRALIADGVDPNTVLNPQHAAQAGGVTVHKAHEMRGFTSMGTDNQNFEIYRGTAKDIDSKVIPLLKFRAEQAGATPRQRADARNSLAFFTQLSNAMNLAGQNPVAADKAVRQLTGLDTIEAVELVGGAITALGEGRAH